MHSRYYYDTAQSPAMLFSNLICWRRKGYWLLQSNVCSLCNRWMVLIRVGRHQKKSMQSVGQKKKGVLRGEHNLNHWGWFFQGVLFFKKEKTSYKLIIVDWYYHCRRRDFKCRATQIQRSTRLKVKVALLICIIIWYQFPRFCTGILKKKKSMRPKN